MYSESSDKLVSSSNTKKKVVALAPRSKVENDCGSRGSGVNPKSHLRLLGLLGCL